MGKGYQRRRIEAKKQAERTARKRARRRRLVLAWTTAVAVLGLGAGVVTAVLNRDDPSLLGPKASGSPSPGADKCTERDEVKPNQKQFAAPPCMGIDAAKNYTATLETSLGTLTVDLFEKQAPETVNNFVFLANLGLYNGTPFHRVIPDFGAKGTDMVQGGDYQNKNGTGGPGYQFEDENTIPLDKPGYLAMANSGPGTNGSQFFILDGPVAHLNAKGSCPGPQGCHSVFGVVTDGLTVVDKIAHVKRDAQDKPEQDVVLRSVKIQTR